jgi:hypothetical protein
MDALEGQLYGFVDSISKVFHSKNPYHNFRRTAHNLAWSEFLFEKIQDLGAGHVGSVETGPWYRFTLAMTALMRDTKHTVSGVADKEYWTKQALNHGLDVLMDDFPELYNEIVWRFPQFLHLLRKVALGAVRREPLRHTMDTFTKKNSNVSARNVAEQTATAMELVLKMADVGHFAQSYDCFSEWIEADFTEQRLAHTTNNRRSPIHETSVYMPQYHSHCTGFFQTTVLPLAEQCEQLLPKSLSGGDLTDAVAINLKNFEAECHRWTVPETENAPTSALVD